MPVQTDAFEMPAGNGSSGLSICEVILATESPLLQSMLGRVIGRVQGLQIREAIADPAGLMSLLEHTTASWVIVTLGPDQEMPEVVGPMLTRYPAVSVLGIAVDGSEVKLGRGGVPVIVLADLTLDELLAVILGKGGCGLGE